MDGNEKPTEEEQEESGNEEEVLEVHRVSLAEASSPLELIINLM
jgi:hypothetical protein